MARSSRIRGHDGRVAKRSGNKGRQNGDVSPERGLPLSDRPIRVAYTLEQLWHDVPGGSAVATLEVAKRLAGRDDVEIVGVAGRHRSAPTFGYEAPFDIRQLPIARPWLYETWNRCSWPSVERATGPVDVCHSTIAIPAPTAAPQVVTVHDVAFNRTPERFTRHGVRVMNAGLKRCRAAEIVLCPSVATQRDLIDLGFAASGVRVVPWGVTPSVVTMADRERVRVAYDLPERFILFVGTIEPRKNLQRLAAAVDLLDPEVPLVIAGASGWGDAPTAANGAHSRFIGFVPAADLGALYDTATVVAYPSLQEGFGLPVAEAMAHGTAVVTSRGTATEEVAGGAAVLVDPTSVTSIADGLRAALRDAASWSARGLIRATELSWDATAASTVEAYRAAIEARR